MNGTDYDHLRLKDALEPFRVISRDLQRPGIDHHASLAAAIAAASGEMVRRRNSIDSRQLFHPALSCGLPVICACTTGISRLARSVSECIHGADSHMHQKHTTTGSLSIWEPDVPTSKTEKKKLSQMAEKLADTGFDQTDLGASEAVVVLLVMEGLSEFVEPLSKLLSRGLLVTDAGFGALAGPGGSHGPESGALKEFSKMADLDRHYRVSPSAVDALKRIEDGGSAKLKHHRVRTAKLATVLCAGRRFLREAPPAITQADVENAQALCQLAESPIARASALAQSYLQRMLNAFPPEKNPVVPLSEVQRRVRRSRAKGEKSVTATLEELELSGHIRIVKDNPSFRKRGGRTRRSVHFLRPALTTATTGDGEQLLLPLFAPDATP